MSESADERRREALSSKGTRRLIPLCPQESLTKSESQTISIRGQRYLTPDENSKLRAVLGGDLDFLRLPIEVSLGTGLRKRIELLRLRGDHINFSVRSVFYPVNGGDVEISPGWLIVVEGKGRKYRLIPMNSVVREALLKAMQDRSPAEFVFDANTTA